MSELRRYRVNARLTIEDLADRSGVPATTIYRIESGRTQRPHVSKLAALADVLAEALGEPVLPADIDPILAEHDAA